MNQNNLSANLISYKSYKNLSLGQLAAELDIPKSTLRNILTSSNATLVTVLQIAKSLGLSLDLLVCNEQMPSDLFILKHLETMTGWISELPPEKHRQIANAIAEMWRIIGE